MLQPFKKLFIYAVFSAISLLLASCSSDSSERDAKKAAIPSFIEKYLSDNYKDDNFEAQTIFNLGHTGYGPPSDHYYTMVKSSQFDDEFMVGVSITNALEIVKDLYPDLLLKAAYIKNLPPDIFSNKFKQVAYRIQEPYYLSLDRSETLGIDISRIKSLTDAEELLATTNRLEWHIRINAVVEDINNTEEIVKNVTNMARQIHNYHPGMYTFSINFYRNKAEGEVKFDGDIRKQIRFWKFTFDSKKFDTEGHTLEEIIAKRRVGYI